MVVGLKEPDMNTQKVITLVLSLIMIIFMGGFLLAGQDDDWMVTIGAFAWGIKVTIQLYPWAVRNDYLEPVTKSEK